MPAHVTPEGTASFEHMLRELLEETHRDEFVEIVRAADGWLTDEGDLLILNDETGDQWVVTVREVA